ncbi:MAG: PHP domain-containing protein [Planctomycetota bacterium]|nr:PHP domain-containing protein [Planctomycetota bacterium]
MNLRNPFRQPGRWYKANFHTHTTMSDGLESPAETAEAYRKAGYHVLALTDHHKTNDVSGLSRKNFLVVSGLEYHPRCPDSANMHHLVGINVPHGFGFVEQYPADANACIRAIKSAGGDTFLAHPLWCGHRYDMYSYLRGLIGIEVYNSTCDRRGRADGQTDWCHILDAGRIMPALAVDDSHGGDDRFDGWVWLRMPSLTVGSVMKALRSGCYYSSTGPKIHDFRVRRGVAEVSCSPVGAINFVARNSNGARRLAAPGKSIRKFLHPAGEDWKYVRAVVTDHTGKKAWTNPIVL